VTEHKHDHEPQAIRAQALESLLIEKGLLTADAIDDVITQYGERVGPLNGARVVARAWTDLKFKQQLLADGTSAIDSFGFEGGQVEKLIVIENTDEVHNAVVCTLCSCYPWAALKAFQEKQSASQSTRAMPKTRPCQGASNNKSPLAIGGAMTISSSMPSLTTTPPRSSNPGSRYR